jgi:hypothetical protein
MAALMGTDGRQPLRFDHVTEALSAFEVADRALHAIDVRSLPGDLATAIREAREDAISGLTNCAATLLRDPARVS